MVFFCLLKHLFQELSKIAMPVIFNEPLSFLQRLTEYMEHTHLIHQANATTDSVERMKVAQCQSFLFLMIADTQYFPSLKNMQYVTCNFVIISHCSVVCCSICCVGCSIAVGEDWETLQPTTRGNLWAHQVRQQVGQYLKCTRAVKIAPKWLLNIHSKKKHFLPLCFSRCHLHLPVFFASHFQQWVTLCKCDSCDPTRHAVHPLAKQLLMCFFSTDKY